MSDKAREVIARMVASVCSDGNSDPDRLADAILAALAGAGLKFKEEWQTIESAPKDGTRILLRDREGFVASGFWSRDPVDDEERNWDVDLVGWLACDAFTHWRNLPTPPAGAKTGT